MRRIALFSTFWCVEMRQFDPNAVIAAAFKAAGLPVPEIPTPPLGATPRVEPGPIITAALKAAKLVQS